MFYSICLECTSYQQPPRRVSKLHTRQAGKKRKVAKRQKYKREIAVRREDSVKLGGGEEKKEKAPQENNGQNLGLGKDKYIEQIEKLPHLERKEFLLSNLLQY